MASDMSNAARVADGVSRSLAHALESPTRSLAAALSTPTPVAAAQNATGWFGFIGWLLLATINLVSTILYWVIRIATINVPLILYTLFSTSWTVTMNATTLYAERPCNVRRPGLTVCLACSSWRASCRR